MSEVLRARRRASNSGIMLALLSVAGWGAAPLTGHPELAWPILLIGVTLAVAIFVEERRKTFRADAARYLAESLGPLLGISGRSPAASVVARRWTNGWPGTPRHVRLRYGVGRLKLDGGPVELGESRWVAEVARQVGSRLDATYTVKRNDPVRGRLDLRWDRHPPAASSPEAEPPAVLRAKNLVNELLAGTASITSIEVDDESGEVRKIEATHQVGSKLVSPGYRARVERTVSSMLPGRWRARWDMEADSVTLEVRPTLPSSLWIPPLTLPDDDPLANYRSVEIPYGVDEDGEAIIWQPAVTPQWLITGETGSGKTSTGHGILAQITQFGWPVWVADGKGTEFLGFQDWPNVQVVASRIEEQVAVIHRAWQLMEHRYQLVVERRARVEDFEPLMIFVDELTDLLSNLNAWYGQIKVKGDPSKPPTLSELGSILRKGRTARVHAVVSMQRPDAAILGGELRENLGQRTSMGQLSPQGAQMMWNNPITGVSIPRGRTGRAIGINRRGVPVEMQCYRVPDPKEAVPGTAEHELLEQLRPDHARHDRLLIIPPETDWSTDEPKEPTFTDYADTDWVLASDRPDLDPLARIGSGAAGSGRALSSALSLLGLTGGAPLPAPTLSSRPAPAPGAGMSPTEDNVPNDLYADGYSAPVEVAATSLSIGDLVCVDDTGDAWAVVEEDPIEDFEDLDSVVIAWRDDRDDSGQLSVPSEAMIVARRPLDI